MYISFELYYKNHFLLSFFLFGGTCENVLQNSKNGSYPADSLQGSNFCQGL